MKNYNGNPGFIWFFVNSWDFVVEKSFKSKVEFFKDIIPSWIIFCGFYNE